VFKVYVVYATLLIFYIGLIVFNKYKKTWSLGNVMKEKSFRVLSIFKNRRVIGEILRDLSLASLVNFLYQQNKSIYEYYLVILIFCGIIAGIIMKEGNKNGRC